ncbi:MAG: transposase family protein [Acidobacteria bacterium]|nr:transposase family protein [Acidobacteriota bacterium]
MQASEPLSLDQIQAFLQGSLGIQFEGTSRAEKYGWVEQILVQQQYLEQDRRGRGLIRQYLGKMTGLSRAQVTRLIGQYVQCGKVKVRAYRRHRFAQRYRGKDIELLARVDEAHDSLSGAATCHILDREYRVYGKQEYERLASISVAHLYNLRQRPKYRQQRLHYTKTRPTPVAIGERRRPDPQGRPGYLRVDTVHQGDAEGNKGLYHINAVDEVTQWEIVGATPHISEAWLVPVLEAMLEQFPFLILGFHSDNGSEFINTVVAGLLDKLLIEQTKSRPRHSNDNGLAETKNGAVIRKHMGYGPMAAEQAVAVQQFYRNHFNPYLNFHRPCAQPELYTDEKGRTRRRYRLYLTPWESLQQVPRAAQCLRKGMSLAMLQRMAGAMSDTEAAQRMQRAKQKLFDEFGTRVRPG